MSAEDADHNAAIERIKRELDRLLAAQSEALYAAVYVGMNRDEAKTYDERLEQIKKLVSELTNLSNR